MLEVKNLVKVYKPKKGKEVRALNDVSIKFPEKGLVFILGKSGCGKSTLLNMLGGLDRVDSGEIIIKGKSSKDFSQADFDSYRNTYLGFIFQEYNILNEFTVGANVALAIELQGRKATKEAINEILQQVDLADYATRKPLQLSGGQKQRVAIARALVKNPDIILADEPTGALDSKTGIQVFDTLKELSKDKLVIVVSHDREFAESYGDRVIELKDGEVISDIEKYIAESEKKNEAISIVDDKIIQIEKGYELTKDDVNMINEYLKKNKAIISIDDTTNRDLKKFARIDDSGNKECFKETDEDEIVYEKRQKFRLIRSRLPFKDSFKIGASGLKAKPFRLIISILLSFVAFTLFGLADTISAYNKYTATVDSLIDSNVQNISFEKKSFSGNSKYGNTLSMNESDIESINNGTGLTFTGVYKPVSTIYLTNHFDDETIESLVYPSSLSGIIELDGNNLADHGLTLKAGRYPENENEVAISSYAFESFQIHGYKTKVGDETVKYTKDDLKSEQDFINKGPTLKLTKKGEDYYYKIVGIINTNFDDTHFKALADVTSASDIMNDLMLALLASELSNTVNYSYHTQLFTAKGFMKANYAKGQSTGLKINGNLYYYSRIQKNGEWIEDKQTYSANRVLRLTDVESYGITSKFFDSYGKTTLGERDFILNITDYRRWLRQYYEKSSSDESTWDGAPEWIKSETYKTGTYLDRAEEEFYLQLKPKAESSTDFYYGHWEGNNWIEDDASSWTDDQKINNLKEYIKNYDYHTSSDYPIWVTSEKGTYYQYKYQIESAIENKAKYYVVVDGINGTDSVSGVLKSTLYRNFYINNTGINEYGNNYTGEFAGLYILPYDENANYNAKDYYNSDTYLLIVDDATYASVALVQEGDFSYAITKMDEAKLKSVVKWGYDNSKSVTSDLTFKYRLVSGPTTLLDTVNNALEEMSSIFLYVGLGLALFASLLMMNYIATTISYKKREIGILRAVGARSVDVFGIFFNESLIIAFINFILASGSTYGFVYYINNMMRNKYNITLTILNFGIRQVGLILLIAVAVAALASALPVFSIARKKPIDAIRSE